MFIFLEKDAFSKNTASQGAENDLLRGLGKSSQPTIRRPYRGIQIKEDTYATLSIRRSNGKVIPLTSGSAKEKSAGSLEGQVREYGDFIIQSVVDQRVEKQQIIETFGDSFVYFFGERPRIVTFSGVLINTEDFNWRSTFWRNYDRHLRGTQLVRANARCYLSYDTMVMEGYPIQAQANDDATQPYSIPFSVTMFLTGYYDYSDIGYTRFPDYGKFNIRSLDAVNLELEKLRNRFTSTTGEVRKKNLDAINSGGGLFDTLRGGIRAVNEALSWVGDLTKSIHDVVGGRSVRLPIGIAGFIHATGNPQIGSGGLGSSTILSNEGLGSFYDPTTGTFKTLTGTVRLRMPGPSEFAPAWTSAIYEGKPRGNKSENYDEYPTQLRNTIYDPLDPDAGKGRKRVQDLLNASDKQAYLDRWSTRWEAVENQNFELAQWNLQAESGGFLGDLAEGVNFVKSNFGMIMTAAAFVNDPLGVATGALGISVGQTSQSRIAGRRDQLEAQGISVAPNAGAGALEGYIGLKALETFKNMGERIADGFGPAGPDQPATLGAAYSQNAYTNTEGTQTLTPAEAAEIAAGHDYEPVYEDKNYEERLAQEEEALEEIAEGREEQFSQDLLDEVYGSKDSDASSGEGITTASLDEVYGTGGTSTSVRSPEEIAAILAAAQSSGNANDPEDQSIQGVDSDDSGIDPVV
jgi:hypothetical protein